MIMNPTAPAPIVGMDIAKNVFQLNVVNIETGAVERRKLKRAKIPACAGASASCTEPSKGMFMRFLLLAGLAGTPLHRSDPESEPDHQPGIADRVARFERVEGPRRQRVILNFGDDGRTVSLATQRSRVLRFERS